MKIGGHPGARAALAGAVVTLLCGCNRPGTIDVDLTGESVRFIVDHRGWPRPLRWPRVTEFAVASEADGAVWQLATQSAEGVKAQELAIIYGDVPAGFVQVVPPTGTPPARLTPGRSYFVAAGGPSHVYRMVFALPVDAGLPLPQRDTPRASEEP